MIGTTEQVATLQTSRESLGAGETQDALGKQGLSIPSVRFLRSPSTTGMSSKPQTSKEDQTK